MGYKQVTVSGQTYTVPEGFDVSALENQLEIEKGLDESIDQTIKSAADAPAVLERAQGASLLDLRRDAARTLQSARGLTSSGRGLGIARDVSHATDVKSGAMRGRYAKDINQSRIDAATAKTAGLVEKGKLLEAKASRKAAGAKAKALAQGIVRKYAGDIYTTSGDRKKMLVELTAARDAETNPQAAAQYQFYIDQISDGKSPNSGTVDF